MKNNNFNKVFYYLFLIIILWIVVSSTVQRFKCPEMTETQLFLHIPNSFVCNWYQCTQDTSPK